MIGDRLADCEQAERAKRAKKLTDAQEKLRKMRGQDAPFQRAGPGHTISGPNN